MVEEASSSASNSQATTNLALAYNDVNSSFRKMIDEKALALPMCIHLNRESLKSFLLMEAKTEDVDNVHDSILAKWTKIAQKAKHWMADKST